MSSVPYKQESCKETGECGSCVTKLGFTPGFDFSRMLLGFRKVAQSDAFDVDRNSHYENGHGAHSKVVSLVEEGVMPLKGLQVGKDTAF